MYDYDIDECPGKKCEDCCIDDCGSRDMEKEEAGMS